MSVPTARELLDRLNACVDDWEVHVHEDATELMDDHDMGCLRSLAARVERVLALHKKKTTCGVPSCSCGHEPGPGMTEWPCPTVRILDGEEEK